MNELGLGLQVKLTSDFRIVRAHARFFFSFSFFFWGGWGASRHTTQSSKPLPSPPRSPLASRCAFSTAVPSLAARIGHGRVRRVPPAYLPPPSRSLWSRSSQRPVWSERHVTCHGANSRRLTLLPWRTPAGDHHAVALHNTASTQTSLRTVTTHTGTRTAQDPPARAFLPSECLHKGINTGSELPKPRSSRVNRARSHITYIVSYRIYKPKSV